MEITNFMSFIGVAILLTLAPGPDIMYLLTKSLSGGAKQGIALAMGLSSGPVVHTAFVMAGVAALLQSSPVAFRILMYAGAAYLLFLAWSAFWAEPAAFSAGAGDENRFFSLYKRGLLMNVMNPKVLLFFLALLPQFVQTGAAFSPPVQIGLLGLGFSMQACMVFSAVALFAAQIREKLMAYRNFSLIMNRVEGVLLLFIAAGLLFL